MEFQEIQLLEEKLARLLEYIESLRQEKIALQEQLRNKEMQLKQLEEELARFQEERQRIKGRVQDLLQKIDQISFEG